MLGKKTGFGFSRYTERAILFLLEGAKTKKELTKFVYGKTLTSDFTRLNRDVLNLNISLFSEMPAAKARRSGYGIFGRGNVPDNRIRVVSLDITALLKMWSKCFGKNMRLADIRKALVKVRKIVFHLESIRRLFTIYGKECFPSLFGIINTMVVFTYCYYSGRPTEQQPSWIQGKFMEKDNIRALFRLYTAMRTRDIFPDKTLQQLTDEISKNDTAFISERRNMVNSMLDLKSWSKKLKKNLNNMVSEDRRAEAIFRTAISNQVYVDFIYKIEPLVILNRGEGTTSGFYNILHGGIQIPIQLRRLTHITIEENKKKRKAEEYLSRIREETKKRDLRLIETAQPKSVPSEDMVTIPVTFDVLYPTLEQVLLFRRYFD